MTDKSYAYLRTQDAPVLPAPASESGLMGWLWRNMFSSMTQFNSFGNSVKSLLMIALTPVSYTHLTLPTILLV